MEKLKVKAMYLIGPFWSIGLLCNVYTGWKVKACQILRSRIMDTSNMKSTCLYKCLLCVSSWMTDECIIDFRFFYL